VAAAKSMLGSAAIIVMDDTTDIPKAVTNIAKFFAHESCGQCTPCREGTPWMHKMLKRILNGEGKKPTSRCSSRWRARWERHDDLRVFRRAAIAPVSAIHEVPRGVRGVRREVRDARLRSACRVG
jgi:NADH:ubiquinone oxidoreductase subunit F (NADH-binding)